MAAVPKAIFTHQKALGLTSQQVWFISYIFSFQWSTALPYPSINKMVQHTGYSRAHLSSPVLARGAGRGELNRRVGTRSSRAQSRGEIVSTDLACLMHLDGRRRKLGRAGQPQPVHIADLLASGLPVASR